MRQVSADKLVKAFCDRTRHLPTSRARRRIGKNNGGGGGDPNSHLRQLTALAAPDELKFFLIGYLAGHKVGRGHLSEGDIVLLLRRSVTK